ncbi:hypothetical protein HDV05_007160 [Chytridiales sp. JEL 0842]|nr:hypothetical protein HDV05_007160 [Chytridiales sp. JEL 0842]
MPFYPLQSILPFNDTTSTPRRPPPTIIESFRDPCLSDSLNEYTYHFPMRYSFLRKPIRKYKKPIDTEFIQAGHSPGFYWQTNEVRWDPQEQSEAVYTLTCTNVDDSINPLRGNNLTINETSIPSDFETPSNQTITPATTPGACTFSKTGWYLKGNVLDNEPWCLADVIKSGSLGPQPLQVYRVRSLENAIRRFKTTRFLVTMYWSSTDGLDMFIDGTREGFNGTRNVDRVRSVHQAQSGIPSSQDEESLSSNSRQCNSPETIESVRLLPVYATCQQVTFYESPFFFSNNPKGWHDRMFVQNITAFRGSYAVYKAYRVTRLFPEEPNREPQLQDCFDDKCTDCLNPKDYSKVFHSPEPILPFKLPEPPTPSPPSYVADKYQIDPTWDPPCHKSKRQYTDTGIYISHYQTFFIDTNQANGSTPLLPVRSSDFQLSPSSQVLWYYVTYPNGTVKVPPVDTPFESAIWPALGYAGIAFCLLLLVGSIIVERFRRRNELSRSNGELAEVRYGFTIVDESGNRLGGLQGVEIRTFREAEEDEEVDDGDGGGVESLDALREVVRRGSPEEEEEGDVIPMRVMPRVRLNDASRVVPTPPPPAVTASSSESSASDGTFRRKSHD